MDYRVSDLLRIPFLKNASILSGGRGLQRSLDWYQELYADGSEAESVLDSHENDILILADELEDWKEEQLVRIIRNAVRCGAGCVLVFSSDSSGRIPDRGLQMAREAELPLIVIRERRLPIGILTREIAMNLLQQSRRSGYLEEVFLWVTGEKELSDSDIQVIRQCSGYDFNVGHRAVCVYFEESSHSEERQGMRSGVTGRIQEFCKDWISRRMPQSVAGITDQCFVFFLPSAPELPDPVRQVRELTGSLEHHISGVRFRAGLGNPRIGLDQWKYSFKEAKLVVRAMKVFNWADVRTLGGAQPAALLLDIRDQGQLFRLRDPIVRPLYSLGRKDSTDGELAHTLEMYFRNGKNARLTAEKMFIHRNTLNLRLKKIEKLCGIDLSDPVCCRQIEFAIYVEKCLLYG